MKDPVVKFEVHERRRKKRYTLQGETWDFSSNPSVSFIILVDLITFILCIFQDFVETYCISAVLLSCSHAYVIPGKHNIN